MDAPEWAGLPGLDPMLYQNVDSDPVETLRRQLEFAHLIFNHIYNGVLVTDAEGKILLFNEPYGRFLGIDPSAQIGRIPPISWKIPGCTWWPGLVCRKSTRLTASRGGTWWSSEFHYQGRTSHCGLRPGHVQKCQRCGQAGPKIVHVGIQGQAVRSGVDLPAVDPFHHRQYPGEEPGHFHLKKRRSERPKPTCRS